MNYSYYIAVRVLEEKKLVIQGESLSLSALKKVLEFADEYAQHVPIYVHIHTSYSAVLNTVTFYPAEDFRIKPVKRNAALIILDDGTDEVNEEDDDDETTDTDPLEYHNKLFHGED